MKIYNTLYATSSKGKIKQWSAKISDSNQIIITHGYIDSKQIEDIKVVYAKNVGRSNETTIYEQACLEAESLIRQKKTEGYTEDKEELKKQKLILPMLANKFTERKHYIKYPCFAQPKLDGVRCLAHSFGLFTSRNAKIFPVDLSHISADISNFTSYDMELLNTLDGELFSTELSFQEITSATKKTKLNTKKLKLWVYDIVNETMDFKERYEFLIKEFSSNPENLVLVPTHIVNDESEIMEWHDKFVAQGFEGIIVRNFEGGYVIKHRSNNLLKYKVFEDSEFKIIGGFKDADGGIVFRCITPDNKEFNCRPRGSLELRKEYLSQILDIVTKQLMLTVRYQGFSNDGIPRFPVGISVRDYE